MTFDEILKSLLKGVKGGAAVSLMGYDGIPILTEISNEMLEGADLSTLLVEYSSLLTEIKEKALVFQSGSITEVLISTELLTIILRPLTEEYFVALVLARYANTGKGRYVLRVASPKLVSALTG